MKKVVSVFLCLIMVLSVFEVMPFSASAKEVDIAETGRNIAGNGTDGIYINIEAAPYTTFANNGFDAYGPTGCGWFASARANQITGKGTQTWNGSGWWNYGYSVMGYKRGNSIQAKCLACWSNHVAVVEKVDGNRVLMSEGGYSSTSQVLPVGYNNGYCVIRWTNMNDIIYSQSGQGSFLGYVYLGSAPTPANPVFSINDVSDITETNAYISCSQITNPNGGAMTRVGFQMGISSGNYSINKYDDLPSWTSGYITCDYRMSDVGVTLSPGTKYYYRFYIVISGQTFYSDEKSFTTAGKTFESVNLGDDFVAYIINSKAGMNIGANSEGNVELQTKSDSDNQKWHFLRQSDSSYKIINVGHNQCLDVANFGTANGTNIGLCPSNNTNAQRYFIRDNGSGYSIVPKVNTNAALDISGGSLKNGANIQEYTWNGSNAQMFSIDYIGLVPSVTKEYNGHTYEYYNLSMPWNQAYRFCESKGGHLVTISNESENDYVHSMIDNMIWLGGTAYNNNKKWYWITGEPFDYTAWNTSQPDYYDGKEFYLSMYYNSDAPKKWNDLPLNYSIPFVCEYDNGDVNADSYTPVVTETIDGITYSVFDDCVDWLTAEAICEAKGGQLVKIDSAEKNTLANQLANKGSKPEYWINVTDRFSEGSWSDNDGSLLSYTNWADGEPTNDFNAEAFAVINKSSGKWIDIKGFCPVYRNTGFICESRVPTGITLDKEVLSLKSGDTSILKVTVVPSGVDDTVTWKSSNTNVATVSQSGIVSGKSEGYSFVTATTVNGIEATCIVLVGNGKDYILGDVDGDEDISINDATLIQRHIANISTYAYNEKAADVDEDKDVSIFDATLIQRYLANMQTQLRIGQRIINNNLPKLSNWTEWSEIESTGSDVVVSESRTEYRYKDKQIIKATSEPATPDGYSLISGDYCGEYTNWSSWSGWSTERQSADGTLKQEEATTGYRYYCFACPNCGQRDPYQGACSKCGYVLNSNHAQITYYPAIGASIQAGTWDNYRGYVYIDGVMWTFEFPGTDNGAGGYGQPTTAMYRYHTRNELKKYIYQQNDFSPWQNEPVSDSDTRTVETRTVYRYRYIIK